MSDLGPNFYKKLLEVSASVGLPPESILNVMGLESGFNPSVGKPGSAAGLVQILPKYLSNLGYKGTEADFRNSPGEEQLIYIERLIQKNMRAFNGGKPFKSVTQYYVSNFVPACLIRQDIINEDPNAIIAAENPTEPHIPNVSIEYEKKIYNRNSGLDFNHDHQITYGDLTNKLAQVASGKNYLTQISNLKAHTGYNGSNTTSIPTNVKSKDSEYNELVRRYIEQNGEAGDNMSFLQQPNVDNTSSTVTESAPQIETMVDSLLQDIRASEKNYKGLYKKFLPTHNLVIQVFANDQTDAIEFSRVLCAALDEELLSKSYIHEFNNNIEVQCSIQGPQKLCYDTIKQLTNSIASEFKIATFKIGGIDIKTNVVMNKISSYSGLTIKSALGNYRRFLLKFA